MAPECATARPNRPPWPSCPVGRGAKCVCSLGSLYLSQCLYCRLASPTPKEDEMRHCSPKARLRGSCLEEFVLRKSKTKDRGRPWPLPGLPETDTGSRNERKGCKEGLSWGCWGSLAMTSVGRSRSHVGGIGYGESELGLNNSTILLPRYIHSRT